MAASVLLFGGDIDYRNSGLENVGSTSIQINQVPKICTVKVIAPRTPTRDGVPVSIGTLVI